MLNATSIWHDYDIDVSGRIEAIDGWKLDTLFTEIENEKKFAAAPLAVRMRPRSLGELAGQEDAVGPGSWLHAAIEADTLSSIILYGPAGTGKTSIAHIIAETTRATFVEVSAIGGTVADLRREIAAAEKRLLGTGARTILFVDEIHRFSRSQQDSLLHAVENRTVVLVGATTENPFFEVNSALISRSRVIELHSLSDADIARLSKEAVDWMDENNPVADETTEYGARLKKLTEHIQVDGLPLNFKVYDVIDINAFACGDGSIRVFSSLMDLMTDDELMAIIVHEIGHVVHTDVKDAMKNAYLASAARNAAGSVEGSTAAKLSNSQLGELTTAFTSAQFSQKQESQADDYAFDFCIANNVDPYAMSNALNKLVELSKSGGDKANAIQKMFASHPDSEKRAVRMKEKADAYKQQNQ